MENQIEIYVRPSGDSIHLNLYIPASVREKFIAGLLKGTFDSEDTTMHLEFSVLPTWISDDQQRNQYSLENKVVHVRVPISKISTHFDE